MVTYSIAKQTSKQLTESLSIDYNILNNHLYKHVKQHIYDSVWSAFGTIVCYNIDKTWITSLDYRFSVAVYGN